MPKASHIQTSFNAGELSPTLEGRVDMSKYTSGCAKLENFIPLIQGGAMKRSGTRYVASVKTASAVTRLIPFEFGTTQAYVLEFGNQYMRVYKDGGQVLDGDDDPVEIATPYTTADLDGIQFAQSADVLYLAHPNYNPRKLSRGTGHDIWTMTLIVFDWEPFSPQNLDDTAKVIVSAISGDGITITPSYPGRTSVAVAFGSVDVGNSDFNVDLGGGDALVRAERDGKAAHILSPSGDLPLGLDSRKQYYIKLIDATNFGLSLTPGGDLVTFEDQGSGTHTVYLGSPVFIHGTETGDLTDVGSYFRVSEIISSNHGVWEGGSRNNNYTGLDIIETANAYFQGNVYKLSDKDEEAKSGTSAPIHEMGSESDGRWDWTYLHSGAGYAEIISINIDTNVATANAVKTFPESVSTAGEGAATHRWSHGAWSGRNGYPRCVTFFEDRLWWAGSTGNPQTMWASQTSHYENHKVVDLDESALVFTLNTDQVNVIEWINAGRVLVLGTAGGEFVVSASSETEALVPGNVRVVRHSTYGSKPEVSPLRIDQSLLFVQRAARKLRELTFDDSVNAYVANDMTILSDHIAVNGIKYTAFQQEPHRIIWVILNNGTLLGFTYERAQQVTAWHRHPIGGTNAKVESIASIPNPSGNSDQLWMVVSRTINGATARYVEYMEAEWQRSNDIADAFFVDGGTVYSGASTTTLPPGGASWDLSHLEGESVTILADGATHANKTVSSGSVTLDVAVTKASVGLAYSATLQTMRIEAGAADGTAQGKTKRITNIVLRLDQTGPGLLYGPTDTDSEMDELHLRDSLDPMDTAIPVFDGDTEVLPWPEGYEQLGRVSVKHILPGPCTVTAVMPQLLTQDR